MIVKVKYMLGVKKTGPEIALTYTIGISYTIYEESHVNIVLECILFNVLVSLVGQFMSLESCKLIFKRIIMQIQIF